MNDRMKESLSALVDGEADELEIRRVLNQTENDEALREQWGCYQLIGSVMRGEPASTVDLSKGIMQAIDGVPMDEVPATVEASGHSDAVPTSHYEAATVEHKSGRFSWITSGAVAASVTLAVLLGARLTESPEVVGTLNAPGIAAVGVGASAVTPHSTTPVLSSGGQIGSQLVSVASEQLPFSPLLEMDESELSESELREAQEKLRAYVMQHSEHAALNSGRGLMPFARVSNFDADEPQ